MAASRQRTRATRKRGEGEREREGDGLSEWLDAVVDEHRVKFETSRSGLADGGGDRGPQVERRIDKRRSEPGRAVSGQIRVNNLASEGRSGEIRLL